VVEIDGHACSSSGCFFVQKFVQVMVDTDGHSHLSLPTWSSSLLCHNQHPLSPRGWNWWPRMLIKWVFSWSTSSFKSWLMATQRYHFLLWHGKIIWFFDNHPPFDSPSLSLWLEKMKWESPSIHVLMEKCICFLVGVLFKKLNTLDFSLAPLSFLFMVGRDKPSPSI